MQEFTQTGGVRVLGISLFLIGFDLDGPSIYQIDCSGLYSKIKGGAIGKNASIAIDLIKKRFSRNLNISDLYNTALVILQEISDVPLKQSNVYIASVTDKCEFRVFGFREIEILLKNKNNVF
jgi:20S proteasome subunit alpha 2